MKDNVIQWKSYEFALRVVNLYRFPSKEKREFVLSKQVLRSGTSIGANIEESIGGCSKRDFINKMAIAYKEARETAYWVKLLRDSGFINPKQAISVLNDCEEILRIITKIQRTAKN